METKHTPGPWVFIEDVGRVSRGTPKREGDVICFIARGGLPESIANGRLIAAAPDLLQALEHIVAVSNWATTIQSEEQYDAMIADAEAALVKARGQRP